MTPTCTPPNTEFGFAPSAAPAKSALGRDSKPIAGAAARVSFVNSRLVNRVGNWWFVGITGKWIDFGFRIWVRASGFMT
jgi:hypothetical protein